MKKLSYHGPWPCAVLGLTRTVLKPMVITAALSGCGAVVDIDAVAPVQPRVTESVPVETEAAPKDATWRATAGATLHTTVRAWAGMAGWDVEWTADTDYPLAFGAEIGGDFQTAVRDLVEGFWAAKPQPHVTFFKNKVLVIHTGMLR